MKNRNDISANLRKFAEENFNSLADLARKLGMNNPQQLNPYTSGKSILGGEKLAILRELGCDINWLLTGETSEERTSYIQEIELPVLADISAGLGELTTHDSFPDTFTLHYDSRRNYIVRIDKYNGESMKPFINENDLIVADPTTPKSNEIAVVSWVDRKGEQRGAIKFIQYNEDNDESIVLISNNPATPMIFLEKERDQVKAHKVVMIVKSK